MMASTSAGGGVMFIPEKLEKKTNKMAKALEPGTSNDNPEAEKPRTPLTNKQDPQS